MRKSKQTLISLGPSYDSVSWQTWSEKWGSWDNWFHPKVDTSSAAETPLRRSSLRELLFAPLATINKLSREDQRGLRMPRANH
jgi:hypothetical protein